MTRWLLVVAFLAAIIAVLWSINEAHAKTRHHHHHKHHVRHQAAAKSIVPVVEPIANSGVIRGLSSWYGAEFEGRKTACGNRFTRFALTAASRSLPCWSIIQVVNLKNGKRVNLTVTDYGPAASTGRILDVSESAAKMLGFQALGTTTVDVQRLSK